MFRPHRIEDFDIYEQFQRVEPDEAECSEPQKINFLVEDFSLGRLRPLKPLLPGRHLLLLLFCDEESHFLGFFWGDPLIIRRLDLFEDLLPSQFKLRLRFLLVERDPDVSRGVNFVQVLD